MENLTRILPLNCETCYKYKVLDLINVFENRYVSGILNQVQKNIFSLFVIKILFVLLYFANRFFFL